MADAEKELVLDAADLARLKKVSQEDPRVTAELTADEYSHQRLRTTMEIAKGELVEWEELWKRQYGDWDAK